MKKIIACLVIFATILFSCPLGSIAQNADAAQQKPNVEANAGGGAQSSDALDALGVEENAPQVQKASTESVGFHQSLKRKFIDGNAGFMSLVALALVLGLAFCIERIIYLSLSEIDAKRFMGKLTDLIVAKDIEKAKELSKNTRGPVASILLSRTSPH